MCKGVCVTWASPSCWPNWFAKMTVNTTEMPNDLITSQSVLALRIGLRYVERVTK